MYTIEQSEQKARKGKLTLSNNVIIDTPVFMPVGTQGTVKAIEQEVLEKIGYSIILGNLYHLYLRPGTSVIQKTGGLKEFISWNKGILTDSGGYQTFSLQKFAKFDKDGVYFQSHIDGSKHFFTPETVIDIQGILKSDIIMPIDDCPALPCSDDRIMQSLERTHNWLYRSKKHWEKKEYSKTQALFGIVQGGNSKKARKESSQFASSLNLPGYSIGGLSVGEKKQDFLEAIGIVCDHLPENKPRYLMGVGSITHIIQSVELGVDMFDCVLPTRNARNGQAFTNQGIKNIRNQKYQFIKEPLDLECKCFVCQKYHISYIRHLLKCNEILSSMLLTYHNLYFFYHFMKEIQEAIKKKQFGNCKKKWLEIYS